MLQTIHLPQVWHVVDVSFNLTDCYCFSDFVTEQGFQPCKIKCREGKDDWGFEESAGFEETFLSSGYSKLQFHFSALRKPCSSSHILIPQYRLISHSRCSDVSVRMTMFTHRMVPL